MHDTGLVTKLILRKDISLASVLKPSVIETTLGHYTCNPVSICI